MMWRDEAGMLEMLLTYIGECEDFSGWSSWRRVLVEILSCHEEAKRQRGSSPLRLEEAEGDVEDEANAEATDERSWPPAAIKAAESATVGAGPISGAAKGQEAGEEWSLCLPSPGASAGQDVGVEVKNETDSDDEVQIVRCEPPQRPEEAVVTPNRPGDGSLAVAPGSHLNVRSHSLRLLSDEEIVTGAAPPLLNLCTGASDDSIYVRDDEVQGKGSKNQELQNGSFFRAESIGTRIKQSTSRRRSGDNCEEYGISTGRAGLAKHLNCVYCGKKFFYKALKVIHERSHTGERPYKCSYCSKSFAQRGHCISHEQLHLNQKPYKCSYCSESFARKFTRISHERRHTGEKPYACSYCDRSFAQLSTRIRHERIHK